MTMIWAFPNLCAKFSNKVRPRSAQLENGKSRIFYCQKCAISHFCAHFTMAMIENNAFIFSTADHHSMKEDLILCFSIFSFIFTLLRPKNWFLIHIF